MATVETLNDEEVVQALTDASERKASVSIAVETQGHWSAVRCAGLYFSNKTLLVKLPSDVTIETLHLFVGEQNVNVIYTNLNRNHVFSAAVTGMRKLDSSTYFLVLTLPEHIRRVTRRSSRRAFPPPGENLRAVIWPGGCSMYDYQQLPPPETPAWTGNVLDISNGGMMARTHRDASNFLDRGDIIGIRLTFGRDQRDMLIDGSICHAQPDGKEMVLLGIRFFGIDTSQKAREDFLYCLDKIEEYRTAAQE